MKSWLTAGILGAAIAYFLDPNSGAGRRNKTLDQLTSLFRQGTKKASKKAAFVTQQGTGMMRQFGSQQHDNDNPDDNTLRDRVESEIFADTETGRENININVVDGTVTVRGEQPTQTAIDALIARIKGVRGVKGVESYLHLPGTPAPNKESAIQAS